MVLCSLVSITQAEYKMAVGLTQSKHGAIPDNAIVFTNSTKPPIETIQCQYDKTNYFWQTTVGKTVINTVWNGEKIISDGGQISTFNYNGYTYSRGVQQTFLGPPLWEICRIKIK